MYSNDSVVKFKIRFLNTEITEMFFFRDLKLVHPEQEELNIHLSVKLQEFIKRNIYTEIHHNGSNSYEFIAEIKSVPDLDDDNYDGNCVHSISETINLNENLDVYSEFNNWLVNTLNITVESNK